MRVLGHQGWTDFFSQFGLYNHMYRKYGNATVMVVQPEQLPFVRRLFFDTGIDVELADLSPIGSGTCVLCHQTGSPVACPRAGGRCKYPTQPFVGLCAFDDYSKWARFRETTMVSFVEAFYIYHDLPASTMYDHFNVKRTPATEIQHITDVPYYVYHTQPAFPLRLPRGYAVKLENSSSDFFQSLGLIEHATEIHLLQSSYSMFVYLLQLKYGLLSNKSIFVHTYARTNANTEYRNVNRHPQVPNWTFL
jgi:hypothetical protein